ncbi:hypothetical protein CLOBOL_00484 [Enterocloster bolteae ATCC BAA-613]|uniref:Uncharacterized protein n=1 Tax=Enterocloster bolteae (strain ATCC BAA-613 / DSM 15670 / CCUG 46953 / JCM 12243 / WAL 16351) TaxID=411902 RepID=A8RHR4_ENTBW|nr:hypothetical protein CLOBOL_00484 [Enterocloster bolteae ATCC BAA-613]
MACRDYWHTHKKTHPKQYRALPECCYKLILAGPPYPIFHIFRQRLFLTCAEKGQRTP